MSNSEEKALVEKALKCGTTGCVQWHPKEAEKVRKELARYGLTPEGIQKQTIIFAQAGGSVRQVKETRTNYSHRDYYYKVIYPTPGLFPKGLFVEMELHDPDPEVPVVLIVNAHEQK